MKLPGMTLIIPSYNRADLIPATIQSALGQTHPFEEIIVVDDCSTDDTLSVLSSFRGKITVIASEKIGVQAARNKGVSAATTPYITLCDSDDLLNPDYVETVATWLCHRPECDTVYANFQTFSSQQVDADKFSMAPPDFFDGAALDGDFLHDIPDLYGKMVQFQPLFPTGMTTRKTFYEKIGGFDVAFNGVGAEDWEYTLRAVAHGSTAVCNRPLAMLRRHGGNDSGNQIRMLSGEITILEHALARHAVAQKYQARILASVDERRISLFNLAFGNALYDIAAETLNHICKKPGSMKFRIKQAILFARNPRRLWAA